MRDVRVLHIGLSNNVGGIETVVHSWLKYKPEWLHFDFIQIGEDPIAFEQDFIEDNSNIYKITPRADNYVKSKNDLISIIESGSYDYVHHHIMSFSWPEPALIVDKRSNSRMILHAHTVISDQFSAKYRFLHWIGKAILSQREYLEVACSQDAGRAMFKNDAFTVIKNGIDFAECRFNKQDREKIRGDLGYNNNEIVIGHVGRSAFEKNYPYLLRSFKLLHDKCPNSRLVLLGDILNDEVIQSLIDSLEIREYTTCTGKVRNITQYYSAMDVFFLPSIIEGVSVSLLEAQASGLPCIISENVSKESVISELCDVIQLNDIDETVDILKATIEGNRADRKNYWLDDSYDLRKSSSELFDFYQKMIPEI